MNCYLCGCSDYSTREGQVRDNSSLKIFECDSCGLVYLSSHDHIGADFYQDSGMHRDFDFKRWRRESARDDLRRYMFLESMIENRSLLDFGSGNGGFLKLARESALEIAGIELERAVIKYYESEEIPVFNSVGQIRKKYDVITLFHVLEHFIDPIKNLQELMDILSDEGKIIIEVPNANDALLSIYENEAFSRFTYWSCHLYLFTYHTLWLLAKRVGLKIDFIKHIQRYPLSNHLYWLSRNSPGGDRIWGDFIGSHDLRNSYEVELASLNATDTIIACFSLSNKSGEKNEKNF